MITAGGITDGQGIAAALTLGADAVQIGTAFLACEESGAVAPHRAALFSGSANQTMLTRAFTGRLARTMRSDFAEQASMQQPSKIAPYPAQVGWCASYARQPLSKVESIFCRFMPDSPHRCCGIIMRQTFFTHS